MSEKKRYLKMSENLFDGEHEAMVPVAHGIREIAEAIEVWAADAVAGESVTIELVELTDAELERIPEL